MENQTNNNRPYDPLRDTMEQNTSNIPTTSIPPIPETSTPAAQIPVIERPTSSQSTPLEIKLQKLIIAGHKANKSILVMIVALVVGFMMCVTPLAGGVGIIVFWGAVIGLGFSVAHKIMTASAISRARSQIKKGLTTENHSALNSFFTFIGTLFLVVVVIAIVGGGLCAIMLSGF